jgi:hypothetical protein
MVVDQWIDLKCHPSVRPEAVGAIQALVRRPAGAELQITYRLHGDVSRIRVPQCGVPCFAMRLWRHTCFEAFIATAGRAAYHEFNFAPSGEWAVYVFHSYRDGAPFADEKARPRIAVCSTGGLLELDAVIRLDGLSAVHSGASLRIGLSAVIEAGDGLSYWALHHPADEPDFHHADGFALELEAPPPGR